MDSFLVHVKINIKELLKMEAGKKSLNLLSLTKSSIRILMIFLSNLFSFVCILRIGA